MKNLIRSLAEKYQLNSDVILQICSTLFRGIPSNLIFSYDKNLYTYMLSNDMLVDDYYMDLIENQKLSFKNLGIISKGMLIKLANSGNFPKMRKVLKICSDVDIFPEKAFQLLFYSIIWLGQTELTRFEFGENVRRYLISHPTSPELCRIVFGDSDLTLYEYRELCYIYYKAPCGRQMSEMDGDIVVKLKSGQIFKCADSDVRCLDIFQVFDKPHAIIGVIVEETYCGYGESLLKFADLVWNDFIEFTRIRDFVIFHLQKNIENFWVCRIFPALVNEFAEMFRKKKRGNFDQHMINIEKISKCSYRQDYCYTKSMVYSDVFEFPEEQCLAYLRKMKFDAEGISAMSFCHVISMQICFVMSIKIRKLIIHRLSLLYSKLIRVSEFPDPEFLDIWAQILYDHGRKNVKYLCMAFGITNMFSVKFLVVSGYSHFITKKLLEQPFIESRQEILKVLEFDKLEHFNLVRDL